MKFSYPYLGFPYSNNYSRYGYNYCHFSKSNNFKKAYANKTYTHNDDEKIYKKDNNFNMTLDENKKDEDSPLFQIFGVNLYFDDILIICLIFFLYQEGVKDECLFIVLILLLIS